MFLQADRQASAWRAYMTVPPASGTLPVVHSCMYLPPQPFVMSPPIGRKSRDSVRLHFKIYLLFFEYLFLLKNWPWLFDRYFFQSVKTVLDLSTQILCSNRPGCAYFYHFTPQLCNLGLCSYLWRKNNDITALCRLNTKQTWEGQTKDCWDVVLRKPMHPCTCILTYSASPGDNCRDIWPWQCPAKKKVLILEKHTTV